MKSNKDKGYSVGAACRRLGIGPHTLRAWETRYGAVEPARTEMGQRLYSVAEVERLELIVQLVNMGHSVGVVARLSDKELARLLSSSGSERGPQKTESQILSSILEELEHDLIRFDIHRISSLLDQKRTALGTRGFVLEILSPLMGWLGKMVHGEDLSIAHEHAISAVVRDQIYQTMRYGSAAISSKACPHFVLATPEDDLHEFGILISAALLAHHGMQSHFLGPNLPAEALAMAVKAVHGDIVLLANSPVPEQERTVSFEEYLRVLNFRLPKNAVVWIGGSGKVPHLRSVLAGREHRYIGSLGELDSLIARTAAGLKGYRK